MEGINTKVYGGRGMIVYQEAVEKFISECEAERIRRGMSQAKFAELMKLSPSGYRKLENREVMSVNLTQIIALHELTGKWLFEMIKTEESLESNLLDNYRMLSDRQKGFVNAVAQFEREFAGVDEEYMGISVIVPTGDLEDGMIWDSCSLEKVNAYQYLKRYGDQISCGIKITSNHLHPAYNDGDIVLISKRPIRDGDTGVFVNRETGRAYLRKFRQQKPCLLEPLNDFGNTFTVDPQNKSDMDRWIKFGVVIAKMR